MTDKVLGILELENKPLMHPGALSAPGTFSFPVERLTVSGATTDSVVGSASSDVKKAYLDGARRLEREGASAIISNCGFSGTLQAEVAAAVKVPVALSSLMSVPFMAHMLAPGKRVGILTYDATELEERHFNGVGWSSSDISVVVRGIEGSETWRALAETDPQVSPDQLTEDVLQAVQAMLDEHPDIGGIVIECAGLTLATPSVRKATGLPVFDFVSLGRMLVEISPPVSSED